MKQLVCALAALSLLFLAQPAHATTISVDPVTLSICDVPTNIGSISATTTNSGNANGDVSMNALFTLTQPSLLNCVSFHWVQLITHATTNLEYPMGTPVGNSVPIVDTPNGGYWYNDPKNGYIRTPPNEDDQPWYWTAAEEARKGTGRTNFNSDTISDAPTVTAATFKTWLVLQEDSSKTFCVLAGFTWTTGADGGAGNLASLGAPNNAAITEINTALTNSGFNGWTSENNCNVCCCTPEPASAALLVIGGVGVGGRTYLRRRRAA